jgi:hypothetical protein
MERRACPVGIEKWVSGIRVIMPIPLNRPTGRTGSKKSRFQDEDHGMTTDRLTMIFFHAPSTP